MGRGKDLSQADISAIEVYLQETSLGYKEIAKKVGVSKASICRVKRKIDKLVNNEPKRVGRCGRKPCSSARQETILLSMVKNGRTKSSKQLADEWKNHGVQCSPSTVRWKLVKMGYRAGKPSKEAKTD